MKIKVKLLMAIIYSIPVLVSATTIVFNPATDCALLTKPKTILLVHASWCGPCQRFMPIYTDFSDSTKHPESKDWTFYDFTDDNYSGVCGVLISSVPTLFVNNMQALSRNKLEAYIKRQKSS